MGGTYKIFICIIWLILYFILFVTCKKSKKYRVGYLGIIFLLIPLIVFNISGDYFNHIKILNYIRLSNFEVVRFLEIPYVWASKIAWPHYWIWRLLVWGFGVFVVMLSLNNLRILTPYYFSLFFVLIIACFSAPRGYVANAIIMLGLSFFYYYNNNLRGIILGVSILLLSILFHRQSVIALVVLSIVYFFKIDTKRIVLLVIWGLALLVVIRGYIDSILLDLVVDKTDDSMASQYGEKFQTYLGGDTTGINMTPSAILTMIINYSIYVYTLVFYFRNYSIMKCTLPKFILYLFNVSITFIVLSILIGIITGGFQAIAYRILGLALLPILYIVLMLEKENMYPVYTHNAKKIFIIMQLWIFIYMIYCNIVQPTFSDTVLIK